MERGGAPTVTFGPFQLDLGRRRLTRDRDLQQTAGHGDLGSKSIEADVHSALSARAQQVPALRRNQPRR
jgi:hypothetical protein